MSNNSWKEAISLEGGSYNYNTDEGIKNILISQCRENDPIIRLIQCENASKKLVELAKNFCFGESKMGTISKQELEMAKEKLENNIEDKNSCAQKFDFSKNMIQFSMQTKGSKAFHDIKTIFVFTVYKNKKGEDEYLVKESGKNMWGEDYRLEKVFNIDGLQLEEKYAKGINGEMRSGYIIKRPEITKYNLQDLYILLYTPYSIYKGDTIIIDKNDRLDLGSKNEKKKEENKEHRLFSFRDYNPCLIPEINEFRVGEKHAEWIEEKQIPSPVESYKNYYNSRLGKDRKNYKSFADWLTKMGVQEELMH